MAGNALGAEGGRAVAEALQANTTLSNLNLGGEYGVRGRGESVVVGGVWGCGAGADGYVWEGRGGDENDGAELCMDACVRDLEVR